MRTDAFGIWLDSELQRRGWSQAELARRTGVTGAFVHALVRGKRGASLQTCVALARGLGFAPGDVAVKAGLLPGEALPDPDMATALGLLRTLDEPGRRYALVILRALAACDEEELTHA